VSVKGGRRVKKWQEIVVDITASGFKTGYAPVASGTFGTLVAIPFVILLRLYVTEIVYVVVTVLLMLVSFYIAHLAELLYKERDSSKIVIDEIVGYFFTCILLPVVRWDLFVVAFFTFRFFDIVKLWPAIYFDRKNGGVSVVLDDVVAGLYAAIAVQLYFYLSVLLFAADNVSKAGV